MIPVALKCLKRAHFLASLVCGPHHPDSPNTLVRNWKRLEIVLLWREG